MPKAIKRSEWVTWSGKPFAFAEWADEEISCALEFKRDARELIALCVGWYFKAKEAESKPARPVHHWLDLKGVLHATAELSRALGQLKPLTVDQLRAVGVDVDVQLFNLRAIKRSSRKVLKHLPRESRGRSRKSALGALVSGLDWVFEHHVKRTASRRSNQQRAFVELVLDAAEIEYDKLPRRPSTPRLPFDQRRVILSSLQCPAARHS